MEKIKERERKASFMDIDKILEEAKDIMPNEEPKPANDIADLMKNDSPMPPVQPNQESYVNQTIEPEPVINSEQNKFVNLNAINQQQQMTPQFRGLKQQSF